VEIGGDIMVKGHRANGYNWWVSMDTPKPLTTELQQLVYNREESGVAFMTAGNYRNSFLENGQNHSLILNPKTGRPVVYDLRSVTVMHDDPALADAWDTALLCVGKQEAARIADAENLKVLLTYGDGNEPKEHMSKAFAASP
jgi:thiamine biosynthesis lipoprotein